MNNKDFNEFVENNKNNKLTEREKSDIFNNVSEFVNSSPEYRSNNKRYALIAALLVVGIGAGTSYAASNSIPGSLLYPLKDEFKRQVLGITDKNNENVMTDAKMHVSENPLPKSDVSMKEEVLSPKINTETVPVEREKPTDVTVSVPAMITASGSAAQISASTSLGVTASTTENIVNPILPPPVTAPSVTVSPAVQVNVQTPSVTIPHI